VTGPLAPDLEALLAAERRAPAPSAARKARILAGLEPRLGGGAPAAPMLSSSSKLLLVASIACAIGVGGAVAPARQSVTEAVVSPPPAVVQAPVLPAVTPPPPRISLRRAPRRAMAAPDLDSLRAEAAMLERARGALASGDPSAAAAMLREAERKFPRGFLLEEREALWIRALASGGQREAARARAAAFTRRFPASIQAGAIADALRDDVR
jgi:hypothetical protein